MADESSTPHFFKVLIPGFLSNFCIPKCFLKHLSLTESNKCDGFVAVLRDRISGADKAWPVKVDCDGRRFLDGWKEFADDHSLRVGDFLFFRYLGRFVFDVLVCDPVTACERSFPVDPLNQSKSVHSETIDQITECEPVSSQFNGHDLETSHLHSQKNVSVEEKVEFKPSGHPYFQAPVKHYSFTWHAILIPTDFARLHNLAKRWCEMIIIDQKDRSWRVNLRHRKTGKDQVYLASGWDKLRDANGLKVGDSVVFELIDSGSEPVMKFYKLT